MVEWKPTVLTDRASVKSAGAQKAGVLSRASVGGDGKLGREGCSDFDEAQTKLPKGGSNKPSGGLGSAEKARPIRHKHV